MGQTSRHSKADHYDRKRTHSTHSRRKRSSSSSSTSTYKRQTYLHNDTPTKDTRQPISARDYQKMRVNIFKENLGYTDENNPFGDSTLTQPFVWKKKLKLQKVLGGPSINSVNKLIDHTEQKMNEIEMVKKRREQREIEQKMLEEQRELLDREKEAENYDSWVKKEEDFHRRQIIQKTELRIEQGREQPIDIIMKGINILKGIPQTNLDSLTIPATDIFEGLSIEEVEHLLTDIRVFSHEENIPDYKKFWNALCVIGEEAVKVLRHQEREKEAHKNSTTIAPFRDIDLQIPTAILTQINNLLYNKSSDQLSVLEIQVSNKLAHPADDVDPTYWESIQMRLPIFKAKAIVNETKEKWLEKAKETKEEQKTPKMISPSTSKPLTQTSTPSQPPPDDDWEENVGQYSPTLEPYDEDDEDTYSAEGEHEHSPSLHTFDEIEDEELIDPVEDLKDRNEMRQILIKIEQKKRQEILNSITHTQTDDDDLIDPAHKMTTFDDFVRKERKMMEADEGVMTSQMEFKLENHYQWEEKYRPRKPRYFNRVKSGYEWSKYNQTHYDRDNPPPKAVQGYKFNIFYPDLVDKHIAPKWTLEPCIGTFDTVIIRFSAGPPYEDVAFKIINREWSLDTTRGFRNTFDKGILQLHFTFKRYRYRR